MRLLAGFGILDHAEKNLPQLLLGIIHRYRPSTLMFRSTTPSPRAALITASRQNKHRRAGATATHCIHTKVFPPAYARHRGGKTPAERLGLAQAPLDYEDIIYFSASSGLCVGNFYFFSMILSLSIAV